MRQRPAANLGELRSEILWRIDAVDLVACGASAFGNQLLSPRHGVGIGDGQMNIRQEISILFIQQKS